jgi:glycosyltransferase involved in cell wall biosynthesis
VNAREAVPLRVAYAYELDAADVNTQSGRPYYMLRQLQESGCTVLPVFPLEMSVKRLYRWKTHFYRARGLTYHPDREPRLLRSIGRQLERRLRELQADFVLVTGSHAMAEVSCRQPKVLVADATFANVLDRYEAFTGCAQAYVEMGHAQERKALANCTAAVFPSRWAAESACRDYGTEPSKVHVIPFGANTACKDSQTVRGWIEARPHDRLRVLFVGREWRRKGGDILLAACEALVRDGIAVELDVVGLTSPPALPPYARCHGFLDKSRTRDGLRLQELYAQAHFLCIPARAENFGLAFCEAAAHGVPSIATAVGGVGEVVRDGITGYTLPPGSTPQAYAERMRECFSDPQAYRALALSTLAESVAQLNWPCFVRRLLEVVRQQL